MRVELQERAPGTGRGRRASRRRARRRRLDRFELVPAGRVPAFSIWVLALDLWQVVVNGREWTGTDGVYVVDQMQYVAWIRDASHHLLASNLWVLRDTPADYFQPAIVISGGLTALGIAPWLTLLLWKPVAVVAFFFVAREYVNRSMTGLWARRAALALALFFGSFTVVFGSFSVLGDLFPGFLSWGYVFGLIALAAMVGALLVYDRARAAGRLAWTPGLLGALAGLLHPWNGELLILVVDLGELLLALPRPSLASIRRAPRAAGADGRAVAAPAALLPDPRADRPLVEARARRQQARVPALVDRARDRCRCCVPALLALRRRRAPGFLPAATRVWLLGALRALRRSPAPPRAPRRCTRSRASRFRCRCSPCRGSRARVASPAPPAAGRDARRRARSRSRRTSTCSSSPARSRRRSTDNANFIARDERAALDYLERRPRPGRRAQLAATWAR